MHFVEIESPQMNLRMANIRLLWEQELCWQISNKIYCSCVMEEFGCFYIRGGRYHAPSVGCDDVKSIFFMEALCMKFYYIVHLVSCIDLHNNWHISFQLMPVNDLIFYPGEK